MKEKGSLFLLFSIVGIFTLYNVFQSNILFIFGLCFLAISIFILDFKSLILLSVALSTNLMSIKLIDYKNSIYGYWLLIVFLRYFVYEKKFMISIYSFFPFFVFFSVVLTSFIYGVYTPLLEQIRFVSFLIFFGSIFLEKDTYSIEFKGKIMRFYIIGLVLSFFSGIIFYLLTNENIFGGQFSGIRNDRNYFSAMMAVGIPVCILYCVYNTEKIYLFWINIPVLIFAGLLSASRAFFLSLIIVTFFSTTLLFKKYGIKLIFQLFLLIIVLFSIYGTEIISVYDTVFNRFSNPDIQDGSGRLGIWNFYLSKTFSSIPRFLFGNGPASIYLESGLVKHIEHNTFIHLISSTGLLGVLFVIISYFKFYKIIISPKSMKKFIFFMPLTCCLFVYFFISAMFSDYFNFAILLSFITLDYCSNSSKLDQSLAKKNFV